MTFVTPDRPELVKERLQAAVATGFFLFTTPTQPFTGKVYDDGFKLRRVLAPFLGVFPRRNSSQPLIVGQMVPTATATGTTIEVTFRMDLVTAAFSAVWFGAALAVWSVAMVFTVRQSLGLSIPVRAQPAPILAFTSVILLFGYFSLMGTFYRELKKAPPLLCKTLNCQERQET
jgi:hypothetical protein